jgi:methyl-accepting chemotaxis protein
MSMNEFFTVYFPYLIIGVMITLLFWAGVSIVIRPFKSIKKESKVISEKLIEIKQFDDITTRFIEFDKWLQSYPKSDYIQNCILPAWDGYYNKFLRLQHNGVIFTPDVYDFFVEDLFVNQFGRRKLVEVIPGIFLALGIIGTFVGIAAGVSGLDPNGDSTAMKAGIGVLLSGMKIKFLSSIIGIIFSAIWQFCDKKYYYPLLTESFNKIRQSMDEAFPTEEESIVLYQLFKNQEKQTVEIQSYVTEQTTKFQRFLTEEMIPNMISGFSDSINQSLQPHLEQTHNLMSDMVKNASQNQLEGMNKLVNHFVSSLTEFAGNHMKELGDSLQATIEWQKRVHTEMSDLVQAMHESAKGQSEMVEKTTTLTEQIHGYTDKLTDYQTVFETTISQLNETTNKNGLLQATISDLLEKMTVERHTFDKYFTDHLEALKSNIELVTAQTEVHTKLHDQLETNVEKMNTMAVNQQNLSETFSVQIEVQQRANSEFNNLLEQMTSHGDKYAHLQQGLNETTEKNIMLNNAISELLSNMTDERHTFDNIFIEHLGTLKSNVELVVSQTKNHLDLHDKLELNLGKIYDLTQTQHALSETLTKHADVQQQSHQNFSLLLEQLNQYGDKYSNLQNGLNETTEKNSYLQETIAQLLEKMVMERETFHQYFDQHLGHLESNVGAIVSQTEQQVQMQSKLQLNLNQIHQLSETQQSLASTLANQATLSKESNDSLTKLLDKISKHGSIFGELQDELKSSLKRTLDEKHQLDKMMKNLNTNLTDQLKQMDSRSETLKQLWTSQKDSLTSVNKQLGQSMNQFTQDMHRGLEHTFKQFDNELSKSVQHLSKGVNAIQEGIVDLPDALDTLKLSVKELNKYAKTMVKVGE